MTELEPISLEDTNTDLDIDDNINFADSFSGYDYDGGGDSNINKHSDLLKELTNFDPIIQRRVKNWLGLEWDDKVKDYIQKNEAVINVKGAKWAIGFLETYQTKTNFITNLTKEELNYISFDIIEVIWYAFATSDDFGINSTNDWKRLGTELEHSAKLVLAGAGDGKYTKFFGESVHRTENISMNGQGYGQGPGQMPQQAPHKAGIFGNLKKTFLGK